MAIQIQVRRGAAAAWTSANSILGDGEIGFETDTGKFKVGSGGVAWTSLAYASGSTADATSGSNGVIRLAGPIAGTATAPTVFGFASTAAFTAAIATLANPALTGVPTAPTAAVNTNTTQIATMAAVIAQIAASSAGGSVRVSVGTTDTLVAGDGGNLVTYNNAASIAASLPNAAAVSTIGVGYVANGAQIGAGAVTIGVQSGDTLIAFNSKVTSAGAGATWSAVIVAVSGGNRTWLLSGNLV